MRSDSAAKSGIAMNCMAAPIQQRVERQATGFAGDIDQEGQRENGEDVIDDVLADAQAGAEQHRPRPLANDVHRGQLGGKLGLLHRSLEHRSLGDSVTNVPADDDEEAGQKERDPPAPSDEVRLALIAGHQRKQASRQQASERDARLRPARPEAAALGIPIFGRHQHRSTPFAADCEALDDAQQDEADRRPYTDRRVARQQADEHGCKPHQYEAPHQQFLAADAVAEMAEDDSAQRPGDEAHRVGRESQQGPDQRIERGEEQLVEDERRSRAVEEEIVPFDRRANQARGDDASERCAALLCGPHRSFVPVRRQGSRPRVDARPSRVTKKACAASLSPPCCS
jgi:hypothetical protein